MWSESLSSHNTRPLIWGPTLIDRHWLSITHWTLQESCTLAGSVRFLITWLWSADPFISVVNLTYRLHVSVNEKHKSWQWFSLDWDLRSRYWPEKLCNNLSCACFHTGYLTLSSLSTLLPSSLRTWNLKEHIKILSITVNQAL